MTTPKKKPAAKKSAKVKAPLTEVSVSYSIGTKVNIGNYESVDVHLSERRVFDVTGLTEAEVDGVATSVYKELNLKLGDRILDEKADITGSKRKK